ncbi:MAG TPA: EamA family transporter, partial [Cyclobacteriaceae bacterium]|nr:EamA family transporter [Cyclobacteriaceae bacterium]
MKNENLLAYISLAAICIIWGTTYLALRIGVMEFPPFLFTGIRQVTAGILLGGFMLWIRRHPLPDKRYWFKQTLAGFLMIFLGNGLVAWAEIYVSSGVAALLCATMPVWVVLMNLGASESERPNWLIALGVLTGFAGVSMVFGEHLAEFKNPNYAIGIIFIFIATISRAWGAIYAKRIAGDNHPFLNAAVQMFLGGLLSFVVSAFFEPWQGLKLEGDTLWALLYLIAFGSIAAFAAYAYALSKLPITIVSLYAYVNPLVAVVLGWLILDEHFGWRT